MIRRPTKLAASLCAAAAALVLAACGDKCPTESPNIDKVPSCTYPPGATASVTIRVCEKCNQSATTCQVDIQGQTIQLDPLSEACSDASSCSGASCNINPNITCSFQVPATTGIYTLLVYDPGTNGPKQGTLTVAQGAVASCAFP
ncbi:MAG: hypothetical protein U0229_07375 [Anaeromyxobacter sp.]